MQKTLDYPLEVEVNIPRATQFLLFAVALSAAGHIIVHLLFFLFDIKNTPFAGIYRFFDMGEEANFPTYISTLNLLFAGVLCGIIAFCQLKLKKNTNSQWVGLSAGLVLMSMDEAAQIHESVIGAILENYIDRGTGIFYYVWYLVYIPIVVIVGFLYIPFIKRLPLRYSSRFCLAALIFLVGAIGLEMLESVLAEAEAFAYIAISILFEETFEMLSIVILIHTLLLYLTESNLTLKLDFVNQKRRQLSSAEKC